MTIAKILKSFPYSSDGVTIKQMDAGQSEEIRDDILDGLKAEGFVEELKISAPTATRVPPTASTSPSPQKSVKV